MSVCAFVNSSGARTTDASVREGRLQRMLDGGRFQVLVFVSRRRDPLEGVFRLDVSTLLDRNLGTDISAMRVICVRASR